MDWDEFILYVRQLFSNHWSETVVVFPNRPIPQVEPIGDPEGTGYPACWIAVDDEIDNVEQTSGTDDRVDGRLIVSFFQEPDSGDDRIYDLFKTLRAMLGAHGDSEERAIQFFSPRLGNDIGVPGYDWHAREGHFPYTRFQTRAA